MAGLWGDEFTKQKSVEKTKKILDKIAKPKKVKAATGIRTSSKMSNADKIKLISDEVYRILGKFKDNTIVIRTRKELTDYITKAIENKVIAIDTETNNSLDPITCLIAGACLYTPGLKQAYVPINHKDIDGKARLTDQLTENDLKEEFLRLVPQGTKILMHNASFDYEVIKCTCGVELKCYWDTAIAARLLNENESAKLKEQYILHIDPEQEKYSIKHLFKNIDYLICPIELFSLYAAADPFETFKLYEYQKEQFDKQDEKRVYDLFMNLEMPLVRVTADMELRGVELDDYYSPKLSKKYHKLEEEVDKKVNEELEKLKPQIEAWRLSSDANKSTNGKKAKKDQLHDPISVTSTTQLAILLYDILKVPVYDKDKPRGTGEEILEKIGLPICNVILAKRGISKLLSTYIDKLPKDVNPKTGRIHCKFNQNGTVTGRFSSSDPNMQNIPSDNKEIRMMFRARTDKDEPYMLVGSDFSSQEVRLSAFYSQDQRMIEAYSQGKDLYAVIAQSMFGNRYDDNLEFHADGTKNKPGKERRAGAKTVLLGLLYGRGGASIASQINKTPEEGQKIIDNFFKDFPDVKHWIDRTISNGHKTGYVEDWMGRRRHLPELQLDKYMIIDKKVTDKLSNFNPFLGCKDRQSDGVKIDKYKKLLTKVRSRKQYENIKHEADAEGIEIHDNGGRISTAERESVNSRVQGGAATLTKLAMLHIDNDKILNDLGFKMLITVHDEIIGECPARNAEKAADRLCKVMIDTAKEYMNVPMSCDPTIEPCWYLNEFKVLVESEYDDLIDSGLSDIEAFERLCEKRSESTRGNIYEIVGSKMKTIPENISE